MKRTVDRPRLSVTTGAKNVVSHTGARLLVDLADGLGLTEGLSLAMIPTKKRQRGLDRGAILVDVAVAVADGAKALRDLRTLSSQPKLFGAVASQPTAWRALESIDNAALKRIASARAEARRVAWAAGVDPRYYVIDIDGTLVNSYSDKEQAAPTYKRGFGFYPLMSYLDATGEALAAKLRPGNAGSGTATDHVEVLDASLAQLSVDPTTTEVMARADSAGCSHGFVDACRDRSVYFFVGHDLTATVAAAIAQIPPKRWAPGISADGREEIDWAQVAEMTDLVELGSWPEGTRAVVRREEAHPGAQLTFTDVDGHRYQVFLTDHPSGDVAFLEGVYRGRGRCECRIKDAKDTGLANLPSASFAMNEAWLAVVMIACDLMAWVKSLCLDGELSRAEPKRLRYALFHAAGDIVHSSRQSTLRIAEDWPWAAELVEAWSRVPGWEAT